MSVVSCASDVPDGPSTRGTVVSATDSTLAQVDRMRRLEELFVRAVELSESERGAFLADVARDSPDVHDSLVDMLAADRGHSGDLRVPLQRTIAAMLDRVGQRLGPYRLVAEIGAGGMGTVYSALRDDGEFDKRVAVKVMRWDIVPEAMRARFLRERQILAALEHPHIARLLDGGTGDDGSPYLVMEYIAGQPITLHAEARSLDIPARLSLLRQACDAVDHAHRHNVLHRDIKPGNILVSDEGTTKLVDFGIAKPIGDQGNEPAVGPTSHALSHELTTPDERPMTPRYTSPEQLRGEAATRASDVYSLGLVATELLTGALPDADGALPRTHALDDELAAILRKALAPVPAERYASAAALADDLRRYTESRPLVAVGNGRIYRARKWAARARRPLAVLCVAVVAIGAGAAFAVDREVRSLAMRCDDVAGPLETVWNLEARRSVADGFTASGASFAPQAATALAQSADRWAARWVAQARESCRATRVTGTQSPSVLDLRTACLFRRRDELGALLDRFRRADAALVRAAWSIPLPDLDTCADVAVLTGAPPPPPGPEAHSERESIERALAPVEAELLSPLSPERADALATTLPPLVTRAQALRWPPLLARTQLAMAQVHHRRGQGSQARATWTAAAAAASAANDLDRLAAIYADLGASEATLNSSFELGHGWLELAEGTLARLGPRPKLAVRIARHRGLVAERSGRYADALAAYTSALSLATATGPIDEMTVLRELGVTEVELGQHDAAREHLERARTVAIAELGNSHPQLAAIEHELAAAWFQRGDYLKAEQSARRALTIHESTLGPEALEVARDLEVVGNSLAHQGRSAEAVTLLERSAAVFQQRLGPDHPDLGQVLDQLGVACWTAGQLERAYTYGRQALSINEKALGPDHPDVAFALGNVAFEARALGRWDEALAGYRRTLVIYDRTRGPRHFFTGKVHMNLGDALRELGRLDEAARELELARDIFLESVGEGHPAMAYAWDGLGQLALARGRRAEAVRLLEQAVARREETPARALPLAESRFALARALGRGAPRARALAARAREVFVAAGAGQAERVLAVDRWSAS